MAKIFGVPSPKEDIVGSMVWDVYYSENDLGQIVGYCEQDVVITAQVFLRLGNEDLLLESEIKKIK